MNTDNWLFNKKEYKLLRKDYFKNTSKIPEGFIAVKYDLPFKLPFHAIERIMFQYENHDIAMITKAKIRDKEMQRISPLLPIDYTETEIILFHYKHIIAEDAEDLMHQAIDFSLKFLQDFIDALIIKVNSPGLQRISRQDLPQAVPVSVIRSTSFKERSINSYLILNPHSNHVQESPKKLTTNQLNNFIGFVNGMSKQPNPFIPSVLYLRESKNQLLKGNYSTSVIYLQTAFETHIYTLFRLILTNKMKESKEQIENKLKAGYINILKDHLRIFFEKINRKFNYDNVDNPKNILNGYKENVYLLRNKIVHEGYNCTEKEANQAFQIGEKILKRIIDEIDQSGLNGEIFLEHQEIESSMTY